MNLPLIVLKYQGNFEQIKVALFKRDLKNQFFYKQVLIVQIKIIPIIFLT
jgi:hypothetical protein